MTHHLTLTPSMQSIKCVCAALKILLYTTASFRNITCICIYIYIYGEREGGGSCLMTYVKHIVLYYCDVLKRTIFCRNSFHDLWIRVLETASQSASICYVTIYNKCGQEEESSYHILCQSPALAKHRIKIFSSARLELTDISRVSMQHWGQGSSEGL
jgi:hypothetical protein